MLEILAGITIAIAITIVSMQFMRRPTDTAGQRGCDLQRENLQNQVQRYFEETGRMPSRRLPELVGPAYAGPELPVCPSTGDRYLLDRSGSVECRTHEATRSK